MCSHNDDFAREKARKSKQVIKYEYKYTKKKKLFIFFVIKDNIFRKI